MPLVPFESLPDSARVWVFGSDDALAPDGERALLSEVDAFLVQWNAHGHPLTCGRVLADDRFLVIGVDQSTAGASGCSIDGLFRRLRALEPAIGTSLLSGGIVFYRDASGRVQAADRERFSELGSLGDVTQDTHVFDTAVDTAGAWREQFERPARESWQGDLIESAR
jgi:hypothetical protein